MQGVEHLQELLRQHKLLPEEEIEAFSIYFCNQKNCDAIISQLLLSPDLDLISDLLDEPCSAPGVQEEGQSAVVEVPEREDMLWRK